MACIVSAKCPVCSPTAIMSVNRSGNIFCSCKAAESVAPSIARNRMMNLKQDPRRQWKRAAGLRHEPAQLRYHERDKNCNENGASEGEKCRINQSLLHPIPQVLCLHQMLDQAKENLRQR